MGADETDPIAGLRHLLGEFGDFVGGLVRDAQTWEEYWTCRPTSKSLWFAVGVGAAFPWARMPGRGPLTPAQSALLDGSIVAADALFARYLDLVAVEILGHLGRRIGAEQVPRRLNPVGDDPGWIYPAFTAGEALGHRRRARQLVFHDAVSDHTRTMYTWLSVSPFTDEAGTRRTVDQLGMMAAAVLDGQNLFAGRRFADAAIWRENAIAAAASVDRSLRRQFHRLLGLTEAWEPGDDSAPTAHSPAP